MLRYHILASGSTGNLTLIQTPDTNILVDCGLSGKKTSEKLKEINLSLEDIDLLLITHRHSDHTKGLPQLSKVIKPSLSKILYSNIQDKVSSLQTPLLFSSNERFSFKDVEIMPVKVSHDCFDPVCFVITFKKSKIAVISDLGETNPILEKEVHGADYVIMEANYDFKLLSKSSRPYFLKNRILSNKGHLSNKSSGQFLSKIYTSHLKEIVLIHLSQDCNTPEKALQTIKEIFYEKNIYFDHFQVAGPNGLVKESVA
ncbi:hypothetical protein AB834_03285 [PVC group bacterium (ex Bugula neritina AB1)]|nr:hypothetical protein AB834_03285 [PVC group bacterium (ex Bugula neritina AB1)]